MCFQLKVPAEAGGNVRVPRQARAGSRRRLLGRVARRDAQGQGPGEAQLHFISVPVIAGRGRLQERVRELQVVRADEFGRRGSRYT